MQPMIARNPITEGWVLIEGDVLEAAHAYRQSASAATEAGGILMGYRREQHLHIDALTQPFATDRRSRFSFRREAAGHAHAATQRWLRSGHTSDYLGEWHTHPEDHPQPSGKDLRGWELLLAGHERPLIFLIVGLRSCWVGVGRRGLIQPLEWTAAE